MADQGPSHSNVNIATHEVVARHHKHARRLNLDGIATPRLMEQFVNEYFTTVFEDTRHKGHIDGRGRRTIEPGSNSR